MKHLTALAAVFGLLALPLGAFAATSTAASRQATVNWQISLAPGAAYPRATGSAQYQAQVGQSEFQAEVEHVASLAGKRVTFQVNGLSIGTRKVSLGGRAGITRRSERGQPVPAITHGSAVTVLDPSGVMIVSGTF